MAAGGVLETREASPKRARAARSRRRLARVAILALSLGAGNTVFGQEAPSLARSWFDEARLLAEVGDWKSASAYVDEAIGLDAVDSDLRYLKALSLLKIGRPATDSLSELDAALAAGRFARYSEREALTLKASLLVRCRRFGEGLAALSSPGAGMLLDPEYHAIRARALAGLADEGGFLTEIDGSLKRFPSDPRFPRLFLESRLSSSGRSRALGDIILSRMAAYGTADPELPVLALRLMPSVDSRRDAVLGYRSMGGASAAATLGALENGIIDEAAAAAELLSGSYPPQIVDLESALALARSEAGRAAIRAALKAFTGEILADRDRDGVAEERLFIRDGRPQSWNLEPKQDGAELLSVGFSNGEPESFEIDRGGLAIRGEYDRYPRVSSMSFEEPASGGAAGETRRYLLSPGSYSYAPLSLNESRGGPVLPSPSDDPYPLERAVAAGAVELRVTNPGDAEEARVRLIAGVPQRRETFRGGALVATLDYERGRPAVERADLDSDGRFETERLFDAEDGSIAWIKVDTKGNGRFDYREQQRFPFRKEWDLDANGSIDAVQFAEPDGSLHREFSTRLDGRLDEVIVEKDGEILSFALDGRNPPFVPDANPSLTWIGAKPFDLSSNLPSDEGVYTRMGVRYRIVFVGARAFAEVVP